MNPWQGAWRLAQIGRRELAALAWSLWFNVWLRLHPGASLAGWLRVTGRVRFVLHPAGKLIVARRVRFHSGPAFNPVGGHRPLVVAVHRGAMIEIGEGTGISSATLVAHRRIVIGRSVLIGGGAAIYDSDFHPLRAADRRIGPDHGVVPEPVAIGDGAFIGAGATILKGAEIGAGAVVGAASVVTKGVPAGEIWAGNPARGVGRVDAI